MIDRAGPIPSTAGRFTITAAVLVALVGACTASASPPPPTASVPTGGTVRIAVVANGSEAIPGAPYYDPGLFFSFSPLARCCLHRTLLSYNGRPTDEGGAVLRPDLAAELPTISPDGLAWTFHLRPGIRYAPPMDDRVVETRDVITGIEHAVRFGDAPFDDIVGVPAFRQGEVDTIAGLEAPDPTTLVVRLAEPAGDLGNRLAEAVAAPIPAEVLEAHGDEGYAGVLVSSGPYMYLDAEQLDPTNPTAEPIWEGREDQPVVLVRNPSWDSASDPLRRAHVDRIEAVLVESLEQAVGLIDDGDVDLMGEPAPIDAVQRYLDDEDRRDQVFAQAAARVHYLAMSMAVPPFDDPNVRRAANLVIDRAAAAGALSASRRTLTDVAHHLIPDQLENNLLLDYAPLASGEQGDLDAARAAMRESGYDSDGDGSCDHLACAQVRSSVFDQDPRLAESVIADLGQIGIDLTLTDADPLDPTTQLGVTIGIGWGADYPNAANFALLFGQRGLGEEFINLALIGATPEQLTGWGYEVAEVPQVEARVEACYAAVGSDVFRCWAELDQLLTERVMPWVPLAFTVHAWIMSDRVAEFSPDANTVMPALDQIRLHPEP